MIPGAAFGARKFSNWLARELGADDKTAAGISWMVWTATLVLTLDVASLAAEGAASAGAEVLGSGVMECAGTVAADVAANTTLEAGVAVTGEAVTSVIADASIDATALAADFAPVDLAGVGAETIAVSDLLDPVGDIPLHHAMPDAGVSCHMEATSMAQSHEISLDGHGATDLHSPGSADYQPLDSNIVSAETVGAEGTRLEVLLDAHGAEINGDGIVTSFELHDGDGAIHRFEYQPTNQARHWVHTVTRQATRYGLSRVRTAIEEHPAFREKLQSEESRFLLYAAYTGVAMGAEGLIGDILPQDSHAYYDCETHELAWRNALHDRSQMEPEARAITQILSVLQEADLGFGFSQLGREVIPTTPEMSVAERETKRVGRYAVFNMLGRRVVKVAVSARESVFAG